jgi:hypothetical protein
MQFKQYKKDGSADIIFSWKERITVFLFGKIHLSDIFLRHFGNNLVHIVSQWNNNFNEKVKETLTFEDTEIKISHNKDN